MDGVNPGLCATCVHAQRIVSDRGFGILALRPRRGGCALPEVSAAARRRLRRMEAYGASRSLSHAIIRC